MKYTQYLILNKIYTILIKKRKKHFQQSYINLFFLISIVKFQFRFLPIFSRFILLVDEKKKEKIILPHYSILNGLITLVQL